MEPMKCEYCGDEIDETTICDECSKEIHINCADSLIEYGTLCPHCYESLIDEN